MRVADIINRKGRAVVTVTPSADIMTLLSTLAEHNIGAAVVSDDASAISGIVSERDVVRAMAERGAAILAEPVSTIMTAEVHTCTPETRIRDLAQAMTDGRFRHAPLLVDGRLAGIVSIGDIVKRRIAELEVERDSLFNYVEHSAT
jgi:CBS domain-containing protein